MIPVIFGITRPLIGSNIQLSRMGNSNRLDKETKAGIRHPDLVRYPNVLMYSTIDDNNAIIYPRLLL